jgi:hypothetical protein
MKTKRKVTITIDDDLYEVVNQATKRFNLARSRLAQEAISLWLEKKTEEIMAEGYRMMADEDRSYSELTIQAQKEIQK